MLGHVLRSDESTAAHQALLFAVETQDILKGRLGAPRCNLFKLLKNDLDIRGLWMNNFDDLNEIRDLARCRKCWKDRFDYRLPS